MNSGIASSLCRLRSSSGLEFSLLSCALLLAPLSTRSTDYTGFVKDLPDAIRVSRSAVLPTHDVGTAGSTVVMQRRLPYGIAVHDGRNGKYAVHPHFTGNSPTERGRIAFSC